MSPARKSYPFLHKIAINYLNSSRAKRSVKPCDPLYSKILADFDIFNGLVTHFFRKTVIRCYTAGRPNIKVLPHSDEELSRENP